MYRLILVLTFVATSWYAMAIQGVGGTIADLRLSVSPDVQANESSQKPQNCEFVVPADFLKLCRFLMYANSVSVSLGTDTQENDQSLENSFTPLVIKSSGMLRKLIGRSFYGRNVVVTGTCSSTTKVTKPVIICTGIGVLYTSEEKKQLEIGLDAKVLDMLDVAFMNAGAHKPIQAATSFTYVPPLLSKKTALTTQAASIPIYSPSLHTQSMAAKQRIDSSAVSRKQPMILPPLSPSADQMRDNLVCHGILIELRDLVNNWEQIAKREITGGQVAKKEVARERIEERYLRISVNADSKCKSLAEQIRGYINTSEQNTGGLKSKNTPLPPLKIMATVSTSEKEKILGGINAEIENCRENSKECLKKIRGLIYDLISLNLKSRKDQNRKDIELVKNWLFYYFSEKKINDNACIDEFVSKITKPAISPLGGFVEDDDVSEEEHIKRSERIPYDKATRYISDMFHSEALYIYWYQHRKNILSNGNEYFFTQRDMCQSCDDRVAEWMGSKYETHPNNLLVLSTQMCNRPLASPVDCTAVLFLPNATEKSSTLVLPNIAEWSPKTSSLTMVSSVKTETQISASLLPIHTGQYQWKLKYVYHCPRLQCCGMVPGLIRIRVPALTLRNTNEHKPTSKKLKLINLDEEPFRTDSLFMLTEGNYKFKELFPERAKIAAATADSLSSLLENIGTAQPLLARNTALGQLANHFSMALLAAKNDNNINALSYAFKLLDIYSDIYPGMSSGLYQ
ncbi:MAG: hypothetical protein LBT90_01320 [Holosporaceae bacterium]|jgi:hypothetical protein|nr:hypothetical protein [Holosporaceae bacterium]